MIYSLPKLLDVLGLVFLVFFIYSTLGVFIFRDVTRGVFISDIVNFSNFGVALVTLFRCSTGEDWHTIMADLSNTSADCVSGETCGNCRAPFQLPASC